MASVNASRGKLSRGVTDALDQGRVVGFSGSGEVCVWCGGHMLRVYDAATDWSEVTAFTSGQLMAISDHDAPEAYGYAKERMRSEGFEPIE
jgi:hypothetical protein